jgi:hypothetical protein
MVSTLKLILAVLKLSVILLDIKGKRISLFDFDNQPTIILVSLLDFNTNR